MTQLERKWMDDLIEKRGRLRDTLLENNLDQIWEVITSPYSDQAHFVYELLQNADDAGATEVFFEIFNKRLVFRHNGTKHFKITNPSRDAENEDRAAGRLGDVNAITNVKLSTKEKNDIGKFGIGFKSVFIYTDEPHVYDDGMRFSISNYVIPRVIEEDYYGRKKGETIFVFPFREGDGAPQDAAGDILKKLNRLIFPTFFLRNLKRVCWRHGEHNGEYNKKITNECIFGVGEDKTKVQYISLGNSFTHSGATHKDFLVFTRNLDGSTLSYSIGYAIEEGNIVPVDLPAFCYFPTKCQTQLHYIIQAPFLLTSDRANISEADKSAQEVNQKLLDLLAKLAADSIPMLRDLGKRWGRNYLTEDILKIIPLQSPAGYMWEHLEWKCFYERTLECFQTQSVIPFNNGYCTSEHAYVAEYSHMPSQSGGAFDEKDLREFVDDPCANWVFTGIPIYQGHIGAANRDMILRPYILKIVHGGKSVTPRQIIEKVSGQYIEGKKGNIEWLSNFYKWVSGLSNELLVMSRSYALLLDNDWKACPIISEAGTTLFLPTSQPLSIKTVHPDLHQNVHVQELEKKYGLRPPYRMDVIRDIVARIQRTKNNSDKADLCEHLIQIGSSGEATIDEVKVAAEHFRRPNVGVLKTEVSGLYAHPSNLFLPSNRLRKIFSLDDNASQNFVDLGYYTSKCGGHCVEFLKAVGLTDSPRVTTEELTLEEGFNVLNRKNVPIGGRYIKCQIQRLLGIESAIAKIVAEKDKSQMVDFAETIWASLGDLVIESAEGSVPALLDNFKGVYVYREVRGRRDLIRTFESPVLSTLRDLAWLPSKDGVFKSAVQITSTELPDSFMRLSGASLVCELLGVKITADSAAEVEKILEMLPAVDRDAVALGRIVMRSGATSEKDILRALELLEIEKNRAKKPVPQSPESMDTPVAHTIDDREKIKNLREKTNEYKKKTRSQISAQTLRPQYADEKIPARHYDEDEFLPRSVDFMQKVEELQAQVDAQKEQLRITSALQEKAINSSEYTFAWLMARLELEIRASGVNDEHHREASVVFAHIEREPGTENMFILRSPSGSIPQWFEEELDQTLLLKIPGRQEIRTVIESMSVQSFKLRARVKILPGMEDLDFTKVVEARTTATKPAFLLNSLRDAYLALGLHETFNLKENLPLDLRFVFGPPGTGKTTHLVRNELIPLVRSEKKPHVLVLTPTNKAADVLAKRIIEELGDDDTYVDWLTRFGRPQDQSLQANPISREKELRLEDGKPAVVITTAIRFAYDVVVSTRQAIRDIDWDYIIIDEASMIPLMQILYPIYKQRSAKFVISGDPFQISPVVISDLSVGENIYTMVNLTDFSNPKTEPRQFDVLRLYTQYRSVPSIGRVFSEFCYGGLLSHARSENTTATLKVPGVPPLKPLNVFRFPVSRFESIYKVKHLGKSSYQIYSALFIFEYLLKFARNFQATKQTPFRIGVISPYRAQSNIIGKLLEKVSLPKGIDIRVGTIHGFQGDECELIIALLNPPQGMGKGRSFINDKRVLNVAISRARDHLVVVIPDGNTHNIQYLMGPLDLVNIITADVENVIERTLPDLEVSLWGDRNYIETNTYSTGHQDVNVYEIPEKRFEIRSEVDALDVQFHKDCVATSGGVERKSERDRIEEFVEAESIERKHFVMPVGYHPPSEGEEVPLEKGYYILGQSEPLYYDDENLEIDMADVIAIED